MYVKVQIWLHQQALCTLFNEENHAAMLVFLIQSLSGETRNSARKARLAEAFLHVSSRA